MPLCQVIKANGEPCRCHARKGLKCCYAHRKKEETEIVTPKKCDEIFFPSETGKNIFAKPYYPKKMIQTWEKRFGKETAELLSR